MNEEELDKEAGKKRQRYNANADYFFNDFMEDATSNTRRHKYQELKDKAAHRASTISSSHSYMP